MVVAEHAEPTVEPDRWLLWRGVPWAHYEVMLALRGERAVPRLAYLEGVLELMSPSDEHEQIKSNIGCLVDVFLVERGFAFRKIGSWTLKSTQHAAGAEPDECYVLGNDRKDVPDLAIEVIVAAGGLKKLEIYRRLGVREVWFWKEGAIEVYVLGDEGYARVERSAALPDLDLRVLGSFLDRPTGDAIRAYRDALRR